MYYFILNNSLFILYFKISKTLILGACFILYYLKLSGTNGFWSNLCNTDVNVHRAAKLYQKSLEKVHESKAC